MDTVNNIRYTPRTWRLVAHSTNARMWLGFRQYRIARLPPFHSNILVLPVPNTSSSPPIIVHTVSTGTPYSYSIIRVQYLPAYGNSGLTKRPAPPKETLVKHSYTPSSSSSRLVRNNSSNSNESIIIPK
jgi:hypothetical protein